MNDVKALHQSYKAGEARDEGCDGKKTKATAGDTLRNYTRATTWPLSRKVKASRKRKAHNTGAGNV